MFGGICWNQSPSILSISSNRRNRPNPKAFSLRASSSANHLPLASKVLVRSPWVELNPTGVTWSLLGFDAAQEKKRDFGCPFSLSQLHKDVSKGGVGVGERRQRVDDYGARRASGLVKSLHSECLGGYRYAFLNTTAQACTCDCITDGLFSIAGYCTNIHEHSESNIDLSYSTDETSLKKEFSSFGQVIEVKLFKDESTERSRGFAFVQYTCQDDAMLAIENLDRKRMDGRVVYVELAKPMNFRFAAYPRTSGPPTGQNSKNEICSEESSNGEMP